MKKQKLSNSNVKNLSQSKKIEIVRETLGPFFRAPVFVRETHAEPFFKALVPLEQSRSDLLEQELRRLRSYLERVFAISVKVNREADFFKFVNDWIEAASKTSDH